jgi:DNA mismatch repair protein MutS
MPRAKDQSIAATSTRVAAIVEDQASACEVMAVHPPSRAPAGDAVRDVRGEAQRSGGRDPRDTPAMRQYARFKAQHPECVLFFRMGDFYEMFDDDAVLCHKVLGLTLTQRTAGIPMAGVPYHAVETYLRRMIEQGYRVAVCEQVQDPEQAKTVVDRAVTRVLTPGTLVDDALLDESVANIIAAIQFVQSGDRSAAVLASAELSTGAFTLLDLATEHVVDEVARLAPSELLYVETADGNVPPRVASIRAAMPCALTARPAWTFRLADARDCLKAHFRVTHLAGFGLSDDDPAIGPAGALLRYLQEGAPLLQTAGDEREQGQDSGSRASSLMHLRPPKRHSPAAYVTIDASSLRSLEIERTMRSGSVEGSLISVLQRCRTPMGKRLLRQWLCFPLRDIVAIGARQDAVAALVSDAALVSELVAQVGIVQDVARIVGRLAMQRATPRDLVALGTSAARIGAITDLLQDTPALAAHQRRLENLRRSIEPVAAAITDRCVDQPPNHLREGGLFRDHVDAELDEARMLQRDANVWLAAYQKRLIEATNINSLKVGFNQVFGYYIEVTHTHVQKIPDTFSRKQTLKNAERYITPELKDFELRVTTAEARAIEREKALFDRLVGQAASHAAALSEFADIVAELDVLACLADVARQFHYVRPHVVDAAVLEIVQGRHPVLDRTLHDRFVPNDCALGTAECQCSLALITGPNMAGKSTFIRQTALIVLLAHTGSFVPAERAVIGVVDRIFTRIGSSDELHAGQSTFMVEMTETASILHHASNRSLVILDEIGRGTSTLDGLSLAWAIAETISRTGCRALFATHYHELTGLADRLANVTNLHVAVREWGDQVIFLYRILPGRSDRSYGIHVARIAGLPRETVDRASELLETLAVQTEHNQPVAGEPPPSPGQHGAQMNLFTEYVHHPAIDTLRAINIESMTPMQAFDTLRELSGQVQQR